MRKINLNGTEITQDSPAYVIAEIGHNHGGDVDTATLMIEKARACGADAVKFQKRDNKKLYTKEFYDAPYNSEQAYGATYGEHREALEFSEVMFKGLLAVGGRIGITAFATPFDFESVDLLERVNCPVYKIASGDSNNYPLIRRVQETGKPVLISLGGKSLADVIKLKTEINFANVAFLQCTATYPTKSSQMNLRFISKLMEVFPDNIIGLSSHYSGTLDAALAYSLGARIIEKHFTLDRTAKGTDHAFSLAPSGLSKMISYLSETKDMMSSDAIKIILPEEVEPMRKMGKSPYLKYGIRKGEIVMVDNLELRSPFAKLPPEYIDKLPGYKALEDLTTESVLGANTLQESGG
jgi:N-acetylneuraminate synthase/sialic acid synthase